MRNNNAPHSAEHLARQSANLSQHLALNDGQLALTGMHAATQVTQHLASVTDQLGPQAMLVTEFVLRECGMDRVVPHPRLRGEKEVDVTQHQGLISLGTRSVAAAADAAARALHGMAGLMQELATGDEVPEWLGVDPEMRAKGFALNLIHAAVVAGDWELVGELAGRMTREEAFQLTDVLHRTAKAVGEAQGIHGE